MDKTKLLKLASFLDGLQASEFYFGSVVQEYSHRDGEEPCGAVCCAVGWCPVVFPEEVQWTGTTSSSRTLKLTGKPHPLSYEYIAAELFDIGVAHADALFSPNVQGLLGLEPLFSTASPRDVADTIRAYVEKFSECNKEEEEYDG